jgi:hypothetical protein
MLAVSGSERGEHEQLPLIVSLSAGCPARNGTSDMEPWLWHFGSNVELCRFRNESRRSQLDAVDAPETTSAPHLFKPRAQASSRGSHCAPT